MSKKRLLISIGLIIILLTVYIILDRKSSDSNEVFVYSGSGAEDIMISNEYGTMHFTFEAGTWSIANVGYRLDNERLEKLLMVADTLPAARVLNISNKNYGDYGLDIPIAKATIEASGQRLINLKIGENSATKDSYYVSSSIDDAEDKIYLVPAMIIRFFLESPQFYRSPKLFEPGLTDAEFVSILSENDLSYTMIKDSDKQWSFLKPLNYNANYMKIEQLLNKLSLLEAESFRDFSETFEADIIIEIQDVSGNSQKLEFDFQNESEYFSLRTDDLEDTAIVSVDVLTENDLQMNNFLDYSPFSVDIRQVAELEIVMDNTSYKFIQSAYSTNGDTFLLNNKKTDSRSFISLYLNVMTLGAIGWDENFAADEGFSDDFFSISLRGYGKEVYTVSFIERNETSYYMLTDDLSEAFYTDKSKIELVKKWLHRTMNGI